MKQRVSSTIYNKEFREQAVKQVTEERLSPKKAARRLSMPVSTLEYWLKAAQIGKLGDVGKTQRPLTAIELELAKTKRELAEVKMEGDLLKKRRRTLPGKCGEVCDDERITGGLPGAVYVPYLRSFAERVLRLAGASAIETSTE
ncbi:hypothetical protein NTG1052_370023 [Candidatus Nitrotoga sp. 1052]|nr:hypothetical protein NTG1052_370023 [Candidatus Nitrotoga sp. 1052]